MGTYLNPGNSGFTEVLSEKYVDKTGLIEVINGTISTRRKLTCISRPRRFGKSYAAQMLCAYYDRTADSHEHFRRWKIAETPDYEKHLARRGDGLCEKQKCTKGQKPTMANAWQQKKDKGKLTCYRSLCRG